MEYILFIPLIYFLKKIFQRRTYLHNVYATMKLFLSNIIVYTHNHIYTNNIYHNLKTKKIDLKNQLRSGSYSQMNFPLPTRTPSV